MATTPNTPQMANSNMPRPSTLSPESVNHSQSAEVLMQSLMYQEPQFYPDEFGFPSMPEQFHELSPGTLRGTSIPTTSSPSVDEMFEASVAGAQSTLGLPDYTHFNFHNELPSFADMMAVSTDATAANSPVLEFNAAFNAQVNNALLQDFQNYQLQYRRHSLMALDTSTSHDFDFTNRRASVINSTMPSPYFGSQVAFSPPLTVNTPNSPPAPASRRNSNSLVSLIRRSSLGGHHLNTVQAAAGGSNTPSPKKQRFKPKEGELDLLMGFFEQNPFPDRTQRKRLAEQLKLEPKQILFWFQNRRATLKMNGIIVMKPKSPNAATTGSYGYSPEDLPNLTPLMPNNTFFFVEQDEKLPTL
ncbi:hypothetical protein HDU98_009656 [Podochytrium sp. JEL0797]|nr:hypothetical protein HDU98_009656 [Podochytrium sp. JEL0797]